MPRVLQRAPTLYAALLEDLTDAERSAVQTRLGNAGSDDDDAAPTCDGLIFHGCDPLISEQGFTKPVRRLDHVTFCVKYEDAEGNARVKWANSEKGLRWEAGMLRGEPGVRNMQHIVTYHYIMFETARS